MRAGAVATLEMQIIADVARLQKDMRAMEKIVDASTGGMGSSFNRAGAAASQMARDAQMAAGGMIRAGESGKLARHHVQNLAFQFNDLGIQMAMAAQSSKPVQMMMMALMQQGSQIGGIMGQAGIGVRGLATEVGGMVGRFASAHPYLVAIAGAVAILTGALKIMAMQINSTRSGEIDAFTQSLGLSKKELEKLGPVSVTLGDMFKGLGRTIEEYLGFKMSDVLSSIGSAFKSLFGWLLTFVATNVAGIYAVFVGTFYAIKDTWSLLPAALGDAAYSAANLIIKALNYLLEYGTGKINSWISTINMVTSKIPGMGGLQMDPIQAPKFDGIANPFKGAAAKAGRTAAGAYGKAFNEAMSGMQGFFAKVGDNAFAAMQERVRGEAKKLIEDRADKKPRGKGEGEALAREIESILAEIIALEKLGDAYLESDAAALRAEASAKAHEQAIRKKGDYELFYALELRRVVAERSTDAAKQIADLRFQTDSQQMLNNQVAQGLLTSEQAAAQLKIEAQLRPLVAAQVVAEGKAKKDLTDRIAGLRIEMTRANAEEEKRQSLARRDQVLRQTREKASENDLAVQISRQRLGIMASTLNYAEQAEALRKLNLEHEKRLIQLKAENEIKALAPGSDPSLGTAILAGAQEDIRAAEMKSQIDGAADAMLRLRDAADSLDFGSVFGAGGEAIDGMIAAMRQLQQAQVDYQILMESVNPADRVKAEGMYTKAKLAGTMQILGASKRFFKEESAGYKIIMALEKAMMIMEMVNTLKSIALDTAKTGSSVGNAMVRGTADQAAGAAKMFSFLGPFAFPVVAAMIALLAGLGLKGGSSSAPSIPTAEELQEAAGTGSVLGDSKAKSNSIANSLEIVAANSNRDLEYSNSMLMALRSIDTSIAKMAGTVAQQISVSGSMFDTSGARLGSSGSAGFLGLFSSSTTRELWDLGLQLNAANVSDIITRGISGNTYQIVQQIKKSSGFFGIGGGTKTTYETTTGQIDPAITAAIQDVLKGLRQGLIEASKIVGLTGADAIIDSFRVEIGKLSFKDMTGEEIEQQLNAVFSKVGDDMTAAILPGLREMQLVGEGLFETFMRVTRQYQVVDVALMSIGMTFGAVGVASLAARDRLVQLFGSLDDFVTATDFYRDNFLTEAEQIAPIFASVTAEMSRLGLASVDTIAEFKNVVNGLDLTTAAGQDMFAALMKVAPAFSAVEKYQEKLVKQYTDQADALRAYRDELTKTGGTSSFAAAAAQFRSTAASAALGDLTAMGALKGAGSAYLDAAKNNAGSALDYARARAEVINSVDAGIFAAETMADYAQLQIDAAERANAILTEIRDQQAAMLASIAASSGATQRLLERFDADGMPVSYLETPTVDVTA